MRPVQAPAVTSSNKVADGKVDGALEAGVKHGAATDAADDAVGGGARKVFKAGNPAVGGGAGKVFKAGNPAGVLAAAVTSSNKVADGKVDEALEAGIKLAAAFDAAEALARQRLPPRLAADREAKAVTDDAVGGGAGKVFKAGNPAVGGGAGKVFKAGNPAGVLAAAVTSSNKVADGKVDGALKSGRKADWIQESMKAPMVSVQEMGQLLAKANPTRPQPLPPLAQHPKRLKIGSPPPPEPHDCKHHTKCPPGKCDNCKCAECVHLQNLGKRERKPRNS